MALLNAALILAVLIKHFLLKHCSKLSSKIAPKALLIKNPRSFCSMRLSLVPQLAPHDFAPRSSAAARGTPRAAPRAASWAPGLTGLVGGLAMAARSRSPKVAPRATAVEAAGISLEDRAAANVCSTNHLSNLS